MVSIKKIALRDAPGVVPAVQVGLRDAPGVAPSGTVSTPTVTRTPATQPSQPVVSAPPMPTNQPTQGAGFTPAKEADFDIRTMQEKLVTLSNAIKDDARLKTILDLNENDIAKVGFVGNSKAPNEPDGNWGNNTDGAVKQAIVIGKLQMLDAAKEHDITLRFDANTVAGLDTALQHKSAKTISDFIDKMMLSIPILADAMSKPGVQVPANELSYAEKARLTELYNEVAATITLPRGGQVQVMFADIASQEAFQKFVEKNKIKMPGRVLTLISNEIRKQPGAIPASVRPKAL